MCMLIVWSSIGIKWKGSFTEQIMLQMFKNIHSCSSCYLEYLWSKLDILFLKWKAKEFLWVCISTVTTSIAAINTFEKPKNVNSDFLFFKVKQLYSLYQATTKYYVYSFIKIYIILPVSFIDVSSSVSYSTKINTGNMVRMLLSSLTGERTSPE